MMPRIEAQRAGLTMRLMLATNERALTEQGLREFEAELDSAIAGRRRLGHGERVMPVQLVSDRISLRPPDDTKPAKPVRLNLGPEAEARLKEQRKKYGR